MRILCYNAGQRPSKGVDRGIEVRVGGGQYSSMTDSISGF